MAKIDRLGLEKLQHIRNAVDAAYDKLNANGNFNEVQEFFEYIVEILEEAKNDWEKI